jgi:hypothetical protein
LFNPALAVAKIGKYLGYYLLNSFEAAAPLVGLYKYHKGCLTSKYTVKMRKVYVLQIKRE